MTDITGQVVLVTGGAAAACDVSDRAPDEGCGDSRLRSPVSAKAR